MSAPVLGQCDGCHQVDVQIYYNDAGIPWTCAACEPKAAHAARRVPSTEQTTLGPVFSNAVDVARLERKARREDKVLLHAKGGQASSIYGCGPEGLCDHPGICPDSPYGRVHPAEFVAAAPVADRGLLERAIAAGKAAVAQGYGGGLEHTGHADCPQLQCRTNRDCSPRRVAEAKAHAAALRRQASPSAMELVAQAMEHAKGLEASGHAPVLDAFSAAGLRARSGELPPT
jgi:hypothetical protein